MNEPTEFGRYNDALSRRYGVQGAPVGTLASDLFPIVQMSDELMDADTFSLTGGLRYAMTRENPATAAQFSLVVLQNPVGSNVLAVLEAVVAMNQTQAFLTLIFGVPTLINASRGSPLDLRCEATQASALFMGQFTNAVLPTPAAIISAIVTPAGETQDLTRFVPIVIPPGRSVAVSSGNVNQAMRMSARWRERRMGTWEAKLG